MNPKISLLDIGRRARIQGPDEEYYLEGTIIADPGAIGRYVLDDDMVGICYIYDDDVVEFLNDRISQLG